MGTGGKARAELDKAQQILDYWTSEPFICPLQISQRACVMLHFLNLFDH